MVDFKERYRKKEKPSEWTLQRIREAYEKVAKGENGRLGIVQEILRKSTDFLRRVTAPVNEMRGLTLSSVCPHRNSFPLEDYIWWGSSGHGAGTNRKKKHCSWWCAACGGHHERRAPNRILVVQLGTKEHAAPQGLCDNLTNAPKVLANQQKDGDSPIQRIVTGLHERSRKRIMDGLSRFTEADHRSPVDVGHLRKGMGPFCPEAEFQ